MNISTTSVRNKYICFIYNIGLVFKTYRSCLIMAVDKHFDKHKKSEEEIEKLITKGAPVKEDKNKKKEKKWTSLSLRIPSEMLIEVDKAVSKRVGIYRNGWILEAMHEKLRMLDNTYDKGTYG